MFSGETLKVNTKFSGETLKVNTDYYRTFYELLDKNLLLVRHSLERKKTAVTIDVFSDFWTFCIASPKPNQVWARSGNKLLTISGTIGLFVPKFSILEWKISPGSLNFEALLCNHDIPPDMPKQSIVFRWEEKECPRSTDQVFEIIRKQKEWVTIDRGAGASVRAKKIKKCIDQSYQENLRIVDMSKILKIPRTVMPRVFKNNYGISPLSYRNRLRVSESVALLLTQGNTVTTTGLDVGFEDIGRYTKQFVKHRAAPPSHFRFQKLKARSKAIS